MLPGMDEMFAALVTAGRLIVGFDPDLVSIVVLSLRVSLTAVALAAIIALPLGAVLALARFPLKRTAEIAVNTLMGLPPVVVGLVVYLLFSRSGPLGVLGLLFTPMAMIIAQTILVIPIIAAVTRQVIADMWSEYGEQLRSLSATRWQSARTLIWEARMTLSIAVLAGFGRAISEVGAVMIVGGNIDQATRVMTTAIALETSKGNIVLALGLGIVLLFLTFLVNALLYAGRRATGHTRHQIDA